MGPNPVKCVVSLAAPPVIDAGGGTVSLGVTTQPECGWDASSNASWISGLSPTSGQGTTDVSFRVAANEGSSSRDGTIVVNGEQARVSQRAPCRYEVGPSSQTIGASGGDGSVNLVTSSECAWTAAVEANWITLMSAAAGSGSTRVAFTVAPNPGNQRSGSIVVANQRSVVTQTGISAPPPTPTPCSPTISPTSQNIGAAGGAGALVTVSAPGTCQWTATSAAGWITVTSGASGTGDGSVTFSITANAGAARTGTLTIATRTFTVTQAASSSPPPPPSCTYSISRTSDNVDAQGDNGSVNVSTSNGCAWTAASNVSWITLTAGASGTGDGPVRYLVAPNVGGARSGTLTIAGQTLTVTQAALVCSYSISPNSQRVDAPAGSATISVSTSSTCTWTAVSNDSWITVTSGASGTGSATVTVTYTANTGTRDRRGTLTVAGRTATIEQREPERD